MTDTALTRSSHWAAMRHRGFALYWCARVLATVAVQIISVSVGWAIYDLTRDPLMLGFVGLVQFLPSPILVLVTGAVADRFSRRLVMMVCLGLEALCAGGLLAFSVAGAGHVWPIFVSLLGLGIARAFFNPAMQALIPNLVPREDLASAIAWSSSSWQLATIAGPVAGGLLYGISANTAFGSAGVMILAALGFVAALPRVPQQSTREPTSWTTVVAGFSYIRQHRIVLGAISLDLFAVLLGGATALMPAYARDILHVGPWGLGLLRAGPAIGALVIAVWLIYRPLKDHAGIVMFIAVGVFAAGTLVFGISTVPWISIAALIIMGAADMFSVYVRETLIQLSTADAVRGRVNAVNQVFIGASNELGEFRAGVSASLIGIVPAVVVGGIGTAIVAALWAYGFPELRRARRLDGK